MTGNPNPLTLEQPLDITDARRAARRMADQRRATELGHEEQVKKAAEAEAEYRKAYAQAFIQTEGTAAAREAQARSETADKAYERDVAAGMVKVYAERLRGLEGERSLLKSLLEWSARLDPFAVADREPPRRAA